MADETTTTEGTPKQDLKGADYILATAKQYAAQHPVAYDAQTREPSSLSGTALADSVLRGTATFQKDIPVPVVSPSGVPGKVPSERVREALASGYHLDDPNNMAARQLIKTMPDLATGAGAALHGASEAFMGVPEDIANAVSSMTSDLKSSEDRNALANLSDHPIWGAIQQQLKNQHPNLAIGGRVAGELVPALTGIGELGGLAKGAGALVRGGGKAIAKGVAEEAAIKAVPELAEPVARAVATEAAPEVAADVFKGAAPRVEEPFARMMPHGTGAREAAEAGLGSNERRVAQEWEQAEWFAKEGRGSPFTAGARKLRDAGLDGLAQEAEAGFHPAGTSVGSMVADAAPTLALEKPSVSLGRNILGRAADFSVQGTLGAAPKAAQQFYNGDPEQAAETLLWGAGTGALFGSLEGLGVAAVGKGSGYLEKAMASDRLPSILGKAAGTAASKGTSAVAGAALGGVFGHSAVGAIEGAVLGGRSSAAAEEFVKKTTEKWLKSEGAQVARRFLAQVAKDPFGSPLGQAMAAQGNSVYDQALAKVPALVGAMGGGPMQEFLTPEARKQADAHRSHDHAQALAQFRLDSEHITSLAGNHDRLTDIVAAVTHTLDTDPQAQQVASLLQMKMFNAVDFLNSQLPKPNVPPTPFGGEQKWNPTPQQLAQWNVTKAVTMQPLLVFQRLQDGTFSKPHADAMRKVYPTLFRQLQKAVIQTSAGPKPPVLPYPMRVKLSAVLDVPLDPSLQPQRIAAYQSSFNQEEPSKDSGPGSMPSHGSKINVGHLPDSSTVAQRISQKGSQPRKVT